jgi:hypothetical protein
MKSKVFSTLIVLFALSFSKPASAVDMIRFSGHGALEFWKGLLEQNFNNGRPIIFSPLPGVNLRGEAGLSVGQIVFVHYSLNAAVSASFLNPDFDSTFERSEGMYYVSLVGGLAGVHIPVIPVDVYGGTGWGWYGVMDNSTVDLRGIDWRVGIKIAFTTDRWKGGGVPTLTAEYRRFETLTDGSGALPNNLSYQFQTFTLGVGFAF